MKKTGLMLLCIALIIISCKSEKQKLTEKIQANEKVLINDSTKMMNDSIAQQELQAYLEYVSKYPDDTLSSAYLFKAADLAHGLKKNQQAVALYKQFYRKYPSHEKAASSLFLEAFLYDSELGNKDSAKIVYRQFLEKYPTHVLASSAKALLDQIEMGLSDEDLVRMFEARLDSSKNK